MLSAIDTGVASIWCNECPIGLSHKSTAPVSANILGYKAVFRYHKGLSFSLRLSSGRNELLFASVFSIASVCSPGPSALRSRGE